MCNYNTDMADERIDEYKTVKNLSSIDGIEVKQTTYDEFKITEVNVLNERMLYKKILESILLLIQRKLST